VLRLKTARFLKMSAIRFLLVGMANTLLGLFVIYAAKWLLHMGDAPANLLGYACALILSFTLNSSWSFRYDGRILPAIMKFVAVIIVAYLLNFAMVMAAIKIFAINSYIAQMLGIIPYTLFTYLGSWFIVFRLPMTSTTGQLSRRDGETYIV